MSYLMVVYSNILKAARLDFNWLAHPIVIVSIPIYLVLKVFGLHNRTYEKEYDYV